MTKHTIKAIGRQYWGSGTSTVHRINAGVLHRLLLGVAARLKVGVVLQVDAAVKLVGHLKSNEGKVVSQLRGRDGGRRSPACRARTRLHTHGARCTLLAFRGWSPK